MNFNESWLDPYRYECFALSFPSAFNDSVLCCFFPHLYWYFEPRKMSDVSVKQIYIPQYPTKTLHSLRLPKPFELEFDFYPILYS